MASFTNAGMDIDRGTRPHRRLPGDRGKPARRDSPECDEPASRRRDLCGHHKVQESFPAETRTASQRGAEEGRAKQRETLQRILRRQGATSEAIRAVDYMACDTCGDTLRRKRPKPVRLPSKYVFNAHLQLDVFYATRTLQGPALPF